MVSSQHWVSLTKNHDFPEVGAHYVNNSLHTHTAQVKVPSAEVYICTHQVITTPGGCHCHSFSLVVGNLPLCIPYMDYRLWTEHFTWYVSSHQHGAMESWCDISTGATQSQIRVTSDPLTPHSTMGNWIDWLQDKMTNLILNTHEVHTIHTVSPLECPHNGCCDSKSSLFIMHSFSEQ